MTDKYSYLTKQGWSLEDAKKYVEMQEKGMSPSKAYQTIKSQSSEPKVEEVFEPKSEYEEYAFESPKSKYFGRKITTEELEEAAGKAVGNVQKGLEYVAEDIKRRGRKKAESERELKEAYNEAFRQASISRARESGRRAGFGGFSIKAPAKITYKREMKTPKLPDMTDGDMGMSMGDVSMMSDLSNIGSGGREPVGRIPTRGREPVQCTPINNPAANSLASLGAVNSPVNVDISYVSTKISKVANPETKFKGRRPKTETQKPKIKTEVVIEKKFWEM